MELTTHPLLLPSCISVAAVPPPTLCVCIGMSWGDLLFNSELQYANINKTEYSFCNPLAIRVPCLDDFLIMLIMLQIDMTNPENLLKLTKKGRTLMMFVSVDGNPSREETEEITKLWQSSLWNNHIQAERLGISHLGDQYDQVLLMCRSETLHSFSCRPILKWSGKMDNTNLTHLTSYIRIFNHM